MVKRKLTLLIAVLWMMGALVGFAQSVPSAPGTAPPAPSTSSSAPAATGQEASATSTNEPPPAAAEVQTPQATQPITGAQMRSVGQGVTVRGMILPTLALSEVVYLNNNESAYQTAISGTVTYDQASAHRTTSLRYEGGGLFGAGQTPNNSYQNSVYQNLGFTQSFVARRWTFTFGDTLSYLPWAPYGSGYGIPGMGQFLPSSLTNLNSSLLPNQSIVTYQTSELSNSVFGQAQYNLTRRLSVTSVISYGLLDYLDNSILNSHQTVASTGFDYQLRHGQVGVKYSYSRFGYENTPEVLEANTVQLMFSHSLTRNFTADVAGGPQFINPHNSGEQPQTIGSGSVGVTYARQRTSVRLAFTRGVSGGSGFLQWSIYDNLGLSVTRQYRLWALSANANYAHNSYIAQGASPPITRSIGAQVARTLTRTTGLYVNYAFQSQSAYGLCTAGTCALNGDDHTVGFGVYWHPRGIRVGS